jgi:hypothetical protein
MSAHRMKPCRQCGAEKLLRHFYKRVDRSRASYMSVCCDCHKANVYANRALKKEHYDATRRAYLATPEGYAKHSEYMRRYMRSEPGRSIVADSRKAWAFLNPERNAEIIRTQRQRRNERRKFLRAQARVAA